MKFDVKKFANLARIRLTKKEEEKIGKDLESILEYFKELEELNTDKVTPVIGGTAFKNVFREDEIIEESPTGGAELFPETEKGYLKVPKVFSSEGGSASGGEEKR